MRHSSTKSRMRGNRRTVDAAVVNFRSGLDFGSGLGSVLQHLIHGFPLSGPESGHTERPAAPRGATAATVLFHPDFNRRLRNRTESADPASPWNSRKSAEANQALAGLGSSTLTAGGEFHPALRTSAARDERPGWNYAERPAPQQAACPSGIRMSVMTEGGPAAPKPAIRRRLIRRAGRACDAADSERANPIPVCSHRNR
jgi:hypothetical protein